MTPSDRARPAASPPPPLLLTTLLYSDEKSEVHQVDVKPEPWLCAGRVGSSLHLHGCQVAPPVSEWVGWSWVSKRALILSQLCSARLGISGTRSDLAVNDVQLSGQARQSRYNNAAVDEGGIKSTLGEWYLGYLLKRSRDCWQVTTASPKSIYFEHPSVANRRPLPGPTVGAQVGCCNAHEGV